MSTKEEQMIRVMNVVYDIWKKNDSLRFCQLIINLENIFGEDLYYVTDENLIKGIQAFYSTDKNI